MTNHFLKYTKRALLLKGSLFLVLAILRVFSVQGTPLLSPQARISLITITPGEDLYAAFGHSTLWVLDPQNSIDRVYNYGTFDFEQPNFYLNFVKGHLDYTVTVYTFEEQYLSTQYEGRGLNQLILNLDSSQKQKIYDFLEWNALPENRHYLYDFYKDNCATRLRDIAQNAGGKDIRYDSTISSNLSFRAWMNSCLQNHSLMALGMNIGLGAPADQIANYALEMYLPANLKRGFQHAQNHGKPLVLAEHVLLQPTAPVEEGSTIPLWAFTLALLAIATFFTYKKSEHLGSRIFDVLLFGVVGILGLVLALLWFATDHWVCAWNTDLLWANPFCLLYFLLFTRWKASQVVKYLVLGLVLLAGCYYTLAYFFVEKPIVLLFPLILAVQIRALHALNKVDKQNKSS